MEFMMDGRTQTSRLWIAKCKSEFSRLTEFCEQLLCENENLRAKLADAEGEADRWRQQASVVESQLAEAQARVVDLEEAERREQRFGQSPGSGLAAMLDEDCLLPVAGSAELEHIPPILRSINEIVAQAQLKTEMDGETMRMGGSTNDEASVFSEYAARCSLPAGNVGHHMAPPLSGDAVSPSTGDESYFDRQLRSKTEATEPPFKCHLCAREFDTRHRLASHQHYHHRAKFSHNCDVCGKLFRSMWQLKAHTVVHTGERPYECKMCDCTFSQSSSLMRHMRESCRGRRTTNDDEPLACGIDDIANAIASLEDASNEAR